MPKRSVEQRARELVETHYSGPLAEVVAVVLGAKEREQEALAAAAEAAEQTRAGIRELRRRLGDDELVARLIEMDVSEVSRLARRPPSRSKQSAEDGPTPASRVEQPDPPK